MERLPCGVFLIVLYCTTVKSIKGKLMFTNYLTHLAFEGLAALGGYYARGFCKHAWHRVMVAIVWSMVSTYLLVSVVG
jgi:hypothetical protein